jgi:hypothetical protein
MVDLAEAVEAILDAMIAAVDEAREPDGPLEDIRSVVRGDRARPQPAMPAVWVVPEPASCDATTGARAAIAETWTMPVRIAALVSSDDPEAAGREVVRIAALARRAVLGDRRLGLPYVNDVTSTRFDAAVRRAERNRNLHWADATVTVRFRIP